MDLLVVPIVGTAVFAIMIGVAAVLLYRAGRPTAALSPADREPVVIDDLRVRIGGRTVLDGVDLSVSAGQILGLLGPNGAGKSTVLRVVAGLLVPESGRVRVYGHLIEPSAPILQQVGVSIGRPGVLPHQTGRQNLESAWAVTGRPRAEAHLEQVAAECGLGPALDRRAGGYSEGMKQSLALATAMLGYPDVLVLDEPTSTLDPLRTRQVHEQLRRYTDTGRSVLLTTHDMAEAQRICDRVAVLVGGQIVLTEDPDQAAGAPEASPLEERYLHFLAQDQAARSVVQ